MTADKNELPFVAECHVLPWHAAFSWLATGWRDFKREPRIALSYGLIIFLVSWGVSLFAWWLGKFALLASLLSGFIFIAPLLAIGLHSVSKDLENARKPSFRRSFAHMLKDTGQLVVYALILMVILFIWSRSGMMLYAFFPVEEGNREVILEFLAVGSIIGTGFVALVFATAAFSLPMIVDKECDMITALISSVNAVLRNKPAMAVWSLCILALTAAGFATGYLGFIVIMPWLAFSAWHAYRQTINAASWDDLNVSED
jgi:uncharacterized membrane protein